MLSLTCEIGMAMTYTDIYYSWVPERQRWLKVVVEDDRIATAHIDRRLLRILGVPGND